MSVPGRSPVPAASANIVDQGSTSTAATAAGPARTWSRVISLAVATATTLVAFRSTAHAQPRKPKGDAAAAQALFYEARGLMKDGRYAIACPKLEESLRLEYGIGTEFNLADCNERRGLLATAWTGFLNVAAAAKAQNQAERERVARERAQNLEARLPKVVIDVPSPAPPGLEITRDGVVVGSASWGSPIPVDPGIHRVSASAPGKQSWEGAVNASESATVHIAVTRELRGATLAAAPAVVKEAATEPATYVEPRQAQQPFPEPIVEERGGTQRTVGWILSGLGLAGIGVGVGFGVDSLQKRGGSGDHCVDDRCDARGVALRDGAIESGDVATVATAAGGAALVGGLVLILTSPRGPNRKDVASTSFRSFRAVPRVGADGGGLSFQGVLP